MAKVIQCPKKVIEGTSIMCMDGKFPANCYECSSPDRTVIGIETRTDTGIAKYLEEHPPTEEGLNKARYRLAYEDGYRKCIENASEWLEGRIYDIVLSSKPMSQASKEFIDNFKETMEEKL